MNSLTHICPECSGDGKETCNNPDHGFISSGFSGEFGRLGCPVCGHDEYHKVPGGGNCESCNGIGRVTKEVCANTLSYFDIDESPDVYEYKGFVSILLPHKR